MEAPTVQKIYTVEETFDKIDHKFADFYGEYGRKMVNARRQEWNYSNRLLPTSYIKGIFEAINHLTSYGGNVAVSQINSLLSL